MTNKQSLILVIILLEILRTQSMLVGEVLGSSVERTKPICQPNIQMP